MFYFSYSIPRHFQDRKSYKLLPEKSTLREDDVVLVPNVPLLSAAVHVKRFIALKRLTVTGIIRLFEEPLFKRLTAHEYLWGYRDKIISLESLGGGKTHFGLLRTVSSRQSLIFFKFYSIFLFYSVMGPAWTRFS